MVLWIPLLAFSLAVAAVLAYNALVRRRHEAEVAWHALEDLLAERHALAVALVGVVRRVAPAEGRLADLVADARLKAMAAETPVARAAAEETFGLAIQRLRRSPALGRFAGRHEELDRLSRGLAAIDQRIEAQRNRYNRAADALNRMLRRFPMSFIGGLTGVEPRPAFRGGSVLVVAGGPPLLGDAATDYDVPGRVPSSDE